MRSSAFICRPSPFPLSCRTRVATRVSPPVALPSEAT
ncbi:hypothetical protein XOCgx_1604 [Xanthomonas oryzae pv. oryzicola]|nr:hypothetical protein XOCgx_1604 [Xanthomonas oryzae pv. oryzicola]